MLVLLLVILGGLMHAARTFSPAPGLGTTGGATVLASGFLWLAGLFSGDLFKHIGFPRLTGYLIAGILAGPRVLDLVSDGMVVNLRIFNGAAIALIALTAGMELEFRFMRPLLRSVVSITLLAVLGTMVLLSGGIYLAGRFDLLPFTAKATEIQLIAISLVLGVAMSAQSPAVVVALRKEMDADGPLTRTVLGVVVLADLAVILAFAFASSFAKAVYGVKADALQTAGTLSWEILGSGVVGVLIGILVAAFLRNIRSDSGLFVVAVGFVVAEVGQRIQLDPLLIALAAGIFVRNATEVGDRLHDAIETASLPVYVAFFCVAGAAIHVDALLVVGLPALAFVLLRGCGFLGGAGVAAAIAGAPDVVRKYAGFGLLPQAGLALALALIFARTFPDFGEDAAALIFAVVAINEMISPVLYKMMLARSGEAGAALRS